MTPIATIRLGVLGAGDVASWHLDALSHESEVVFAAIADLDPDRASALGRRFRFERSERDPGALLDADDIDLILVLTPHASHAEHVIRALESGKDVLCEKPIATQLADADRMLDTAARTRRRLGVTHAVRLEHYYRHAQECVRSGRLGRPQLVSAEWFTDEIARLDDPLHWKGTLDISGGGVLVDGGAHVADCINGLLGRAVRVSAFSRRLTARREGVGEDTATMQIEYASGALASCAMSFVAGRGLRARRFAAGMRVRIFGETGSFDGGYELRDSSFRRHALESHEGEPDRVHVDDGTSHPGNIDRAILAAWRNGSPPPLTALDARNALAVVRAAYRSIELARPVEVDWRDGA